MTKDRTVFIVKGLSKNNIASNCRPITCLLLAWKLTGIMTGEMYLFLEESKLLPKEQKGYRKGSSYTNGLFLLIKWPLEKLNIGKRII